MNIRDAYLTVLKIVSKGCIALQPSSVIMCDKCPISLTNWDHPKPCGEYKGREIEKARLWLSTSPIAMLEEILN